MEKLTLIDPGFLGEYGIGKWGVAYWSSAINHGIAQISAVCKANGIITNLIDFRSISSYDEFKKLIRSNDSTWYGLTCRTIDVPIVKKACKIIREEKPNSKVIVGGIHPSICPDDFANDDNVDFVFMGECDKTLPLLIKSSEIFDKVVKGDIPNINESPFEDIDIYDYRTSISFSLYGGIINPPMVPIITSRGCVYNCKFCQPAEQILYGKKYRQKSVDNVMEELETIMRKYDFRSIMFYDDCILAHKDFLLMLLEKIAQKKNVEIMLQGRADNICKLGNDIKEFKSLGLRAVIVGFESGSQRVLDFIGKKTTVDQNVKAAELLHVNGIKIVGNFMIGLPTESNDEIKATVKMANTIRPTIGSCTFYSPMPGSYLYEYCKEHDLLIESDYAKLSRDPRDPKIKGVDYAFATKALYDITTSRFKNKVVKMIIGYAYKNLERGRTREILTKAYNKVFR